MLNRIRPEQTVQDRTWNRTTSVRKSFCKLCSNRDKPCLIKYICALFVHTHATFESKSYQLIPRQGWSSILVPVNTCITKYTVLEPCAQPCSVSDRLKIGYRMNIVDCMSLQILTLLKAVKLSLGSLGMGLLHVPLV